MSIAQAIHKLLSTSAPITAAVADHIHYANRPQRYSTPAIVIQAWVNRRDHHLKGAAGAAYGLARVTCLASTYLAAQELGELIRNRLDGYAATLSIMDANGADVEVEVEWLKFDDGQDIPSDHRDGQGQPMTYGHQQDYRYAINEPLPTLT